jgi:tetratricopeptide (TPR) repeat protein
VNVDDRYDAAFAAWDEGDFDRAETCFRDVIEADPDRARAHANLGRLLVVVGRAKEAVRHAERAVSLAPADLSVHAALVEALAQAGRDEDAIAAAARAPIGDDDAKKEQLLLIRIHTASARLVIGDDAGALADARAALALGPDDVDAHVLLARALAVMHRFADATKAIMRAKELAPAEDAIAEIARHIEEGLATVRHMLEEAEIEPESAENLLQVGILRFAVGRRDDAMKAVDRAVAIDPDSADIRTARAEVLRRFEISLE